MNLSDFDPDIINLDLDKPLFDINKDIPSQSKISSYVAEQAKSSTALKEILSSLKNGKLQDPNGKEVENHPDCISIEIAETLFYITHKMHPILSIETGFIFGFSATVIMCAHEMNNLNGGHVPIQENAKLVHNGIGVHTLERFGFTNFQLMEHEAELVMPQMLIQNLAPDLALAFINGSKRFDEIMLEVHYTELMLQKDGIIIINTNNSPARKAVVDYLKTNKKHYNVKALKNGLVLFQKTEESFIGQNEPFVSFKTKF